MDDDRLRAHVRDLLSWEKAHAGFDAAVSGLPPTARGTRPPGAAHTPWQVVEHLRLAQQDVLAFSRDPTHVSAPWPEGYWPRTDAPPTDEAWNASLEAFRQDLRSMLSLVSDPSRDLLAPLSDATEATLLREAHLLADHNAYHLGELVTLRRVLDAWA